MPSLTEIYLAGGIYMKCTKYDVFCQYVCAVHPLSSGGNNWIIQIGCIAVNHSQLCLSVIGK